MVARTEAKNCEAGTQQDSRLEAGPTWIVANTDLNRINIFRFYNKQSYQHI